MFEFIMEALRYVWNFIKRIFVKVLNFFNNIVSWFKDVDRLRKLRKDRNTIAVVIKEKLENGNYNVVNCLFDKEQGEVVDYEEDALIIEAEMLDENTIRQFGDKNMIILR